MNKIGFSFYINLNIHLITEDLWMVMYNSLHKILNSTTVFKINNNTFWALNQHFKMKTELIVAENLALPS